MLYHAAPGSVPGCMHAGAGRVQGLDRWIGRGFICRKTKSIHDRRGGASRPAGSRSFVPGVCAAENSRGTAPHHERSRVSTSGIRKQDSDVRTENCLREPTERLQKRFAAQAPSGSPALRSERSERLDWLSPTRIRTGSLQPTIDPIDNRPHCSTAPRRSSGGFWRSLAASGGPCRLLDRDGRDGNDSACRADSVLWRRRQRLSFPPGPAHRFDTSVIQHPAERRPHCYAVIRTCMPNARAIRITVAKLGLPFSDNAL